MTMGFSFLYAACMPAIGRRFSIFGFLFISEISFNFKLIEFNSSLSGFTASLAHSSLQNYFSHKSLADLLCFFMRNKIKIVDLFIVIKIMIMIKIIIIFLLLQLGILGI